MNHLYLLCRWVKFICFQCGWLILKKIAKNNSSTSKQWNFIHTFKQRHISTFEWIVCRVKWMSSLRVKTKSFQCLGPCSTCVTRVENWSVHIFHVRWVCTPCNSNFWLKPGWSSSPFLGFLVGLTYIWRSVLHCVILTVEFTYASLC